MHDLQDQGTTVVKAMQAFRVGVWNFELREEETC